ncbi:MAG: hypothetical protein CVU84_06395 [Firmicutes bacterium HGW-Firmicutes-1]|jgi:cellulose biosynthesis protein BcsQ|nr:MAG: hypothetical protein CVU84_06395 [Firmicutes bacterium HGW-Firmicutes-1]
MQIAFWSTVHGQTTTTSNAVAIACAIALDYRMKTLITHSHFEKSTLEAALLDKIYLNTEMTQLKDTGIDALSRFIRFSSLDQESVLSYTNTLVKGRLDLLIGTKNTNKELYLSDFNSMIEIILNSVKSYYDLIIVDVPAGNSCISHKILFNSDLIVFNLNQNTNVLEDFFNNEYQLFQQKCVFLISMYDESSRFGLKNLQRKYKLKDNIACIPYCRTYADACNEGKAIDFFIKNRKASKDDSYYMFINEVRKSVMCIFDQLDIDLKRGD